MKLTTIEEYNEWLNVYEMLLTDLQGAWRFKNVEALEDLNKRILNTQVQIAICARKLKKEGYTDPRYAVRSTVSGQVQFTGNSTIDFDSPDRNGNK